MRVSVHAAALFCVISSHDRPVSTTAATAARPPSYVFEGMRALINGEPFSVTTLLVGAALALVQVLLAGYCFARVFRYTVRTGPRPREGFIVTNIGGGHAHGPQTQQAVGKVIPMHRVGFPEDLHGLALFLAFPGSGYITGQEIIIDGGWGLGTAD
jgi:NAD(P)-dependent dehydrogenase (short-subunit alcohol dehydrogenase family)